MALAAVLVVSGCGSGAAGAANGSASFLGHASNGAIFIQWTRAGSQLSGSLQQALLKTDGTVDQQSSSFTGTIAGNGITLQLNQGLGTTKALVGELNGNGFTLTYPDTSNGLIQVTFGPSGVGDYNTAVADLQTQSSTATTASAPPGSADGGTCAAADCPATSSVIPPNAPSPKPVLGNCPTFTGPGDNLVHSENFNASGVSCATAKTVVEKCKPDGSPCAIDGEAWHCTRKDTGAAFVQTCVAGSKKASIHWLD